MTADYTLLVVDDDRTAGETLAADLRDLLDGAASVDVVDGVAEARARVDQMDAHDVVPVVFVRVHPGETTSSSVVDLHETVGLERSRKVVVTSRASLHGADDALRRGAINGMITRPWTAQGLRAQLVANLAGFLVEHAPDDLDRFGDLLDEAARREARARVAQRRAATRPRPASTPLLLDSSSSDEQIERRMVELLDRALGHPPRIRVAPGTILIEAGDDVGGIYVVLDGSVRLTTRTATGEQILHERSTGAIIGLLSLASHRRAMLQCRAVTEVLAVPVTLDQLALALEAEPELSSLLTRVLVGSLARRLRRSDELQMELDQSLAALFEARAQLVSSARFAALGEMAAGMAHELNNPVAALSRATDHLADDIAAVVDDDLRESIRVELDAAPTSTADRRALRRVLTDAIGDRRRAERLLDLGCATAEDALALAGLSDAELERREAGARLGRSLHTLQRAASQVQSLVASLRSYSRGDDGRGPLVADVDVAAGVDDALRLLAHRMTDVDLVREYADCPTIAARPGELQQVWTNVLANALDAMGERGRLTVVVEPSGDGGHVAAVVVRIIDDGPGIPDELTERIFAPRFTTKNGRVQFGLGLGLSISRQIVADHGGSISVESRPGHTEFTVELPSGAAHE